MKRRRWNCVADRVQPGAVGAEVGVYDGGMSNALFKLIPGLCLYMIDRWAVYTPDQVDGDPEARMPRMTRRAWKRVKAQAFAVAAKYKDKAIVIQNDSVAAANRISDGKLDFVFIDGDHSYEGCSRDIEAWLPKVKPGGWLMGHDYTIRPGVKRAVDDLGMAVELDRDKVWAVRL
jgi:hypothetical protein